MFSTLVQLGGPQIILILLTFIPALLFGFWGMKVAQKKGHPKALGFLLGLVFSLVGIIVCYILPDKNK